MNENPIILSGKQGAIAFHLAASADAWRAEYPFHHFPFDIEIYLDEDLGGEVLDTPIDWRRVSHFIDTLKQYLPALLQKSDRSLKSFMGHTGLYTLEQKQSLGFHLNSLEYLPMATPPRIDPAYYFSDHLFELHFTLENQEKIPQDYYGDWITTWKGNQLNGLRREQV
ncbi:MAG: hypothetical protein AAFU64_05745 [Bacteroidota bacterium]